MPFLHIIGYGVIVMFDKKVSLEINIEADKKEVEVGSSLTYTITITNRGRNDISNIILDIYISREVYLIMGEIQRLRGTLDFDEGYKELIIGNLAMEEVAKVILKIGIKEAEEAKDIKCYGVVKGRVTSEVISTTIRHKKIKKEDNSV